MNRTILVLIPKMPAPSIITQFYPISLCSVVYKAITKVVVNGLKPFLDSIVAPTQYNFVLGPLIIDNIIIAQEVINSMRKKERSDGVSNY